MIRVSLTDFSFTGDWRLHFGDNLNESNILSTADIVLSFIGVLSIVKFSSQEPPLTVVDF